MELSKQVCSLESAKRLKELRVPQESYFYWAQLKRGEIVIWDETDAALSDLNEREDEKVLYSAFTVAELGEMLPAYYRSYCSGDRSLWFAFPEPIGGADRFMKTADTEAEARAKMLCYLLENKLITI